MIVLLCSVMMAVLLQGAVSLPPDFFRAGRAGVLKLPPHKKSVSEVEIVDAACEMCGAYRPAYGEECKENKEGIREICLLAFRAKVQRAVDNLTTL